MITVPTPANGDVLLHPIGTNVVSTIRIPGMTVLTGVIVGYGQIPDDDGHLRIVALIEYIPALPDPASGIYITVHAADLSSIEAA